MYCYMGKGLHAVTVGFAPGRLTWTGWLQAGWLAGWLAGLLAAWLAGWLAGWLASRAWRLRRLLTRPAAPWLWQMALLNRYLSGKTQLLYPEPHDVFPATLINDHAPPTSYQ